MNGIDFGERVLFRRTPIGNRMAKMTCLWEDGVFLGVRAVSAEMIVGTEDGVWRTRTMQRRPDCEKWATTTADMVGWGAVELVEERRRGGWAFGNVVIGERIPEERHMGHQGRNGQGDAEMFYDSEIGPRQTRAHE